MSCRRAETGDNFVVSTFSWALEMEFWLLGFCAKCLLSAELSDWLWLLSQHGHFLDKLTLFSCL